MPTGTNESSGDKRSTLHKFALGRQGVKSEENKTFCVYNSRDVLYNTDRETVYK